MVSKLITIIRNAPIYVALAAVGLLLQGAACNKKDAATNADATREQTAQAPGTAPEAVAADQPQNAAGPAVAPNRAEQLPQPGSQGFQAELGRRFLLAIEHVLTAPVEEWREGGLTGLHYLESDFGVYANAAALTKEALRLGITLPRLVRSDPQGLAASKLLEKKFDLDWMRANLRKDVPANPSDTVLLVIGSQMAVGACLPEEADYNARFLKHVDTWAWPRGTEWIHYGLYAGFAMHGCISKEVAIKQTEPLIDPLIKWLTASKSIDLKAYVLFALAASGRLKAVPAELQVNFVRAQRPNGTWHGGPFEMPAQNQAPLGAYVIARMLREGGHPLPRTDFRYASLLPAPKPTLSSAQGGD